MSIGYSMIADVISSALLFYVPAIYIMTPRKGGKYLNYFLFVAVFSVYELPVRFFVTFQSAIGYMLLTYLVLGILVQIVYQGPIRKKLAGYLSFVLLALVIDFFTAFAGNFLIGGIVEKIMTAYDEETYTNMMKIMALLCGNIINIVYALVFLCLVRYNYVKVFLTFMMIPVYHFMIMVGYFMLCVDFSERVAVIGVLMGAFNLVLDILIMYILDGILKKSEMQREVLELNQQRQQEYEFYQKESQSAEEIRQVRHDFANQLQAAYSMMDDPENAGKVKEMLDEMQKKMSKK